MRPPESFVCQPIRSLQTMLRVIAEDQNDCPTVIPDGIYGPDTISAVSAFQRNHGLPVTGITNQETWESVVDAYDHSMIEQCEAEGLWVTMDPGDVYEKGDCNPNIYLIQAMLTTMANFCSSIGMPTMSGMLDDATEDSISSFQQICGLSMTGQIDKNTWHHLALQYPQAARICIQNQRD